MADQDEAVDYTRLTHPQAVARLKDITDEMERVGNKETLTTEDEVYFAELEVEFRDIDDHRKRLERESKLQAVRDAAKGFGGGRVVSGFGSSRSDYDRDPVREPDSVEDRRFNNPWDLSEVRTFGRSGDEVNAELRARALSAVEKMPGTSDNIRAAATNIIENFDDKQSRIARMALLTSSPVYLRAWSKMARNHQHLLTSEESSSLDQVRAMSLTDNAGGYLVPFQLDPTVIITANGSRNDIRQAARQVVATGDVWNGVSSGSVSWSWDAEATRVSDDSTTFGQPTVSVHKAAGFVPISIEALEDEQNVTTEVARLLAFGKDELEAVAFITGTGSGQPTGIVTALAGTSSEVNSAAEDTLALADVYGLQGALPARYRGNSAWLANNLIYNRVRQFDTAGGAALWERIGADRPAQLLGRPALEAEAMDGAIGTTGATSNFVLVYGDFSHYVIADRIGMTVEFIPHLFQQQTAGTGVGMPTGQRGWYAYYRVGADSVHDGAFRMLDVFSTT